MKFFYADAGSVNVGGFDPDKDGDPCDGTFTYIGSYRIPTIGPAGSRQDSSLAVVHWKIPNPGPSQWCIGVSIIGANSANGAEENQHNNIAFRIFPEIEMGGSGAEGSGPD